MFKNDDQCKPQVKCDVENCTYNEKKRCHVDDLKIDTCGNGQAETSDGTKCSSFKKDGSFSM